MTFFRLRQPFKIYLIDNFQECYKALQKYTKTCAYKLVLHDKPYQVLLIYLRRLTLHQEMDYNQMLQKFHVSLQVVD